MVNDNATFYQQCHNWRLQLSVKLNPHKHHQRAQFFNQGSYHRDRLAMPAAVETQEAMYLIWLTSVNCFINCYAQQIPLECVQLTTSSSSTSGILSLPPALLVDHSMTLSSKCHPKLWGITLGIGSTHLQMCSHFSSWNTMAWPQTGTIYSSVSRSSSSQ